MLVLALALGGAWALGRQSAAPMSPGVPVAETAGEAGPLAAKDLDGDGIVYQSGMHPWVVQDEPGQCVVCGMDLTPTSVREAAPRGEIRLDDAARQLSGVRTVRVAAESISRELRTTGQLAPDETRREAVTLRVGGWVERLYARAEGDRVQAGQPLVELYSPQLVQTQDELLLALRTQTALGDAQGRRLLDAARQRLRLFGMTGDQIERLETTGEVQRTVTFRSPASGTVVDLLVTEGMEVQAGQRLFDLADFRQLWLQVDVPEADLGWVAVGTRARVQLDAWPGDERTGTVAFVYDQLDPATRTGTARIALPNADRQLKPGMFATALLFGTPTDARPTVPADAVIRTGGETVVVLALGDGRFRPQPVTLGAEAGGRVQITDGLAVGDEVVVRAQFLLDSESRLSSLSD